MKLRNKKTGEFVIGYVRVGIQNDEKFPNPIVYHTYNSVAKFNEDWEDADATIVRTKNRIEFLERKLKSEKALLTELCGEEEG